MSALGYSLYNLILSTGLIGLTPAALIQTQTKRARTLAPRLGLGRDPVLTGGLVIHALSVGEVISARGLLSRIRSRWPDLPLTLTTATVTGLEQARAEVAAGRADQALVMPLDLLPAVDRFLTRLRPRGVVIVETDIWPNLVRACRLRGIPTALVNFRISAGRQAGHKLLRPFFSQVYSQFRAITLPFDTDQERLSYLRIDPGVRVEVTGSLKYDQPTGPRPDPADIGLDRDRPVLIAGSTHKGEEEAVIRAWQTVRAERPEAALILAPRDRTRFDKVAKLIARQTGAPPARLSQGQGLADDRPVLLADVLGRLNDLYALARAAFVGGSLTDHGGHNPLEPAAWGVPVAFGPFMADFAAEAKSLVRGGGGRLVRNDDQLADWWRLMLTDQAARQTAGRAAEAAMAAQQGAAERTVDLLAQTLGRVPAP